MLNDIHVEEVLGHKAQNYHNERPMTFLGSCNRFSCLSNNSNFINIAPNHSGQMLSEDTAQKDHI